MSEVKTFTVADLAKHSTRDSLYLAIGGKVYDCTKFIDEHPGGEEVLLEGANKDATDDFEDVGHSEEARALLPDMYVGEFEGGFAGKGKAASSTPKAAVAGQKDSGSSLSIVIALAVVAGGLLWKFLL